MFKILKALSGRKEDEEKSRIKLLKEEPCSLLFSMEVSKERIQQDLEQILLEMQTKASLPGFRPGKAPLEIVRKNYSEKAKDQLLDRVLLRAVRELLEEKQIQPVATPLVSSVRFQWDQPLVFQVQVERSPHLEVKSYKRIPLEKKVGKIAEEEVEARLQELRERYSRLEPCLSEVLGKEHFAVIDYRGLQNGQPIQGIRGEGELLEMASSQTVAGLCEGMLGARRGEARDISVQIQGKPSSLRVTLKEIKKRVLPNLDDEWSKDLGFMSLQELRERLRTVLENEREEKTEQELEKQVEDHLLRENSLPVPPTLVQIRLDSMWEKTKRLLASSQASPEALRAQEEKLREKLRPEAEREVKLFYLYRAIADQEKIEIAEEEFQQEQEKTLERISDPQEKEKMKTYFQEHRDSILSALRERKVARFLKDSAKIKIQEVFP